MEDNSVSEPKTPKQKIWIDNQALDEYIALHYIPSIENFLPDDTFVVVESVERKTTSKEKKAKKRVDSLPRIAPKRDLRFSIAKKPAPDEEDDFSEFDYEELRSTSEEFSSVSPPSAEPFGIDAFLAKVKELETFTEAMLRTIREKDLVEADVYNSVFMDRKLFNKIRNDPYYQPSKKTALLLSIALHLTVEETQTLLGKAGFSLTHTSKMDIVIEFFILQGNYNIHDINEALYDRDLPLLNPRT